MILSNQDIQQRSQGPRAKPLVTPFDLKSLRLSSYDLTIGGEFYSGKDSSSSSIKTQELHPAQTFTIPPHGVCFILSEEIITLPHDFTAKVSLRMSLVYRGLILTSQPPLDPGYSGKVIVMVYNLTSESIHLQRGSRIATIEFMAVGNPAHPPSAGPSPNPHRSVVDLRGQLVVPVQSSLIAISDKASKALRSVRFIASQMLIFAALIVAILAVPGFFSYKYFDDRQSDQLKSIESMKKTVEEQASTLKELQAQLSNARTNTAVATSKPAQQLRAKKE